MTTKKIQCTFRLPENIVALIDIQEGETRTEKLLALLNTKEEKVSNDVIQDALHERLVLIEERLALLEKGALTKKFPLNSANQKRKAQTIKLIQEELSTLSQHQILEIRKSRYPLSEVRKLTRISKSQCDSYADMIKGFLNP
ncbi:hypothetical protein AB6C81_23560 [Vibrio splendidus]